MRGWRFLWFLYSPLALLLLFFVFFFPSFLLSGKGKIAKKDCCLSASNLQEVCVKWCCVGEGFAWLKWEVAVKANKLSVYITNQLWINSVIAPDVISFSLFVISSAAHLYFTLRYISEVFWAIQILPTYCFKPNFIRHWLEWGSIISILWLKRLLGREKREKKKRLNKLK